MAQVLRVPSEKFRDKMAGSMRSWVTSLRRELGYVPSVTEVKRLLVEGYERILGIKLTQSMPTNEENRIWKEETMPKHVSREWLTHQRESHAGFLSVRSIKITGGVNVAEADHKARKLIRVRAEMMNNKILNIVISGDFFMIPEESIGDLELRLRGVDLTRGQLLGAIGAFYRESRVETPGIVMEDFVDAIMKLKSVAQESPS
mgnify:CR=1 FL=1